MGWTSEQEALARRDRQSRLEAELQRVVSILSSLQSVRKVVLFGSLVRGRVGVTSDLDLLVVQRTGRRFLDRVGELQEVLEPRVAMDLLVYTEEEVESNKARPFLRDVLRFGRVLHEKQS